MIEEDNKTLWCGNLADQVTEELLYELFLQAGPLEKVRIARDRDGRQKTFAFVTYCHEISVPYAISLFRGTSLFHRALSLDTRGKMARLPPPMRFEENTPSSNYEFNVQGNIAKQFLDMTDRLWENNPKPSYMPSQRSEQHDKLVMASLQGNWSHRHHPYNSKEKAHRQNEYRHKDDMYKRERNKHSSWRDRKGYGNRRRE